MIFPLIIFNAGHCLFRILKTLDPKTACRVDEKSAIESHKGLRKFAIIMTFCSPALLSFHAFFSLKDPPLPHDIIAVMLHLYRS